MVIVRVILSYPSIFEGIIRALTGRSKNEPVLNQHPTKPQSSFLFSLSLRNVLGGWTSNRICIVYVLFTLEKTIHI